MANGEEKLSFLLKMEDADTDEIVSYNQLLDFLDMEYDDKLKDPDHEWTFKGIVNHEGPLSASHPNYKGSKWNVLVQWEDGSVTTEPLSHFAADAATTCALYAKDKDLLDKPGWKRFRHLATKASSLQVHVNATNNKGSFNAAPKFRFGVQIPMNPKDALRLDVINGHSKWQDAMTLELNQINEYHTFKDLGKHAAPPVGYKRIRVHFVYDHKHDGRYKARLVAGGHMTDPPLESTYSGVVSLRSLRIVLLAAELNGLQVHQADVGNAYLEAKTKEKVYIVAGPEFGALEGHTLVIDRALYGLKSSGARWHDRFADTLRQMKFQPSKADTEVWMRRNIDKWEYICVYVDDLAVAMEDPSAFFHELTSIHHFKLKGVGPITYHLGANFGRDKDGTLTMSSKKYINKMMTTYERLFGSKPAMKFGSPLESGDHPEADTSRMCTQSEINTYQSLIGQLQWLVTIGRFDVAYMVMTMSRFRIAPRIGHLERLKRAYGYVRKFCDGKIRFRTHSPDYSQLPKEQHDWMYSVYGNVKEELPKDMPVALGKGITLTTYVDANLLHDFSTGRAATGILHLMNGTPIDWYSKRQATVETATYGSEFVAAKIATEQIIGLRYAIRMLGIPLHSTSFMFGDNQSVVTQSTLPHSSLTKRHHALSYHFVREAVASGILQFINISGKDNAADILTKACGYQVLWPHLQPLLFWMGDTITKVTSTLHDNGE